MGYKIGSFNMHNLGVSALSKTSKRNLAKIAEIIRNEEFDVIALQEVLSEGKAFTYERESIKKSILWELGGEKTWGFEWADASAQDASQRGEGYAFLWNKRRLRLATTPLENGTVREFKPQMLKGVKCRGMQRYPYYARFTPQGTLGGTNFELRLICIHTYYGNDTLVHRAIRQNELDVVMKEIYSQIYDKVYKNDMPHYTIILGDYNVELRRQWRRGPAYLVADDNDEVEVAAWGKCKKVKTVLDELTTLKTVKSADNDSVELGGNGYSCNYDHFSFEEAQFQGVSYDVRRIDAVKQYCNDDFEEYFHAISDHVPIMMEINLK